MANTLLNPRHLFIFFASTFFTSVLWIFFVISFVLAKVAMRFSTMTRFVLQGIAESGRPVGLSVILLLIPITVIYGALWAVAG